MTEPHPLSMSALIAKRDEHRNAAPAAPVEVVAIEPEVEDPEASPEPVPFTATGRTREAGRMVDMSTFRPVPRIEREYAGVVAGATETVWTSTGAPT